MPLGVQVFLAIVCLVTSLSSQISDDFVLPNTTHPESYFLILTTNVPSAARGFTGLISIMLRVVEATNEIFLHSRQHRIDEYKLYELVGSEHIKVDDILLSRESDDIIKITSVEVLKAGSTYDLGLEFRGNLMLTSDGFFRSDYVTNVDGSDVYT